MHPSGSQRQSRPALRPRRRFGFSPEAAVRETPSARMGVVHGRRARKRHPCVSNVRAFDPASTRMGMCRSALAGRVSDERFVRGVVSLMPVTRSELARSRHDSMVVIAAP